MLVPGCRRGSTISQQAIASDRPGRSPRGRQAGGDGIHSPAEFNVAAGPKSKTPQNAHFRDIQSLPQPADKANRCGYAAPVGPENGDNLTRRVVPLSNQGPGSSPIRLDREERIT
jgi:hypothetical protein